VNLQRILAAVAAAVPAAALASGRAAEGRMEKVEDLPSPDCAGSLMLSFAAPLAFAKAR
jgi:hypothetical protein